MRKTWITRKPRDDGVILDQKEKPYSTSHRKRLRQRYRVPGCSGKPEQQCEQGSGESEGDGGGGRDATGAETGEEKEAGPQCDELAVVHGTVKKERQREGGNLSHTTRTQFTPLVKASSSSQD